MTHATEHLVYWATGLATSAMALLFAWCAWVAGQGYEWYFRLAILFGGALLPLGVAVRYWTDTTPPWAVDRARVISQWLTSIAEDEFGGFAGTHRAGTTTKA